MCLDIHWQIYLNIVMNNRWLIDIYSNIYVFQIPLFITILHESMKQGWQIWAQSGLGQPLVGQIWDFFRSNFSTFWLHRVKLIKFDLKKSQICPILDQSDTLLAQIWHHCVTLTSSVTVSRIARILIKQAAQKNKTCQLYILLWNCLQVMS